MSPGFGALLAVAALPHLQYPLFNDGAIGAPRADVNAASAWSVTTGSRSLIVAVVDSGVDITHPQLIDAIWSNPRADQDGLIGDIHGWNFADDNSDVVDDPAAGLANGTLVAGLIAGATTGLAPGVTIMPIKVFSNSGNNPDFDHVAAEGIEFALSHGARVIQISWTATAGSALNMALIDALAADALVVAAAGDEGLDLDVSPQYPASVGYPNVVSVAGTDRYDLPVDLTGLFVTNYGRSVTLAAPTEKNPTLFPGGGTILYTGTEAATPLVSAAAALAWSANPSLSASQVKQLLVNGAIPLPQLAGICGSGARLDAGNTVRLAAGLGGTMPAATAGPVQSVPAGIPVVFQGSPGEVSDPDQPPSAMWSFGDGYFSPSMDAEHIWTTGGAYPVTFTVTNAGGLESLTRMPVNVLFQGTPTGITAASPDPYPAGTQLVVPISVTGAAWIQLHFAQIDLAPGDGVIVYDGAATGLASYQGSLSDVTTAPIHGDSAFVYLRGFTGGTAGFTLDVVRAELDGRAGSAPIAIAGVPAATVAGYPVTLDGSASVSPDTSPLSFRWTELVAPAGSTAVVSSTSGQAVTFTPDLNGSYAFGLTVTAAAGTGSALTWIVTRPADGSGCAVAIPQKLRPGIWVGLLAPLALLLRRRR